MKNFSIVVALLALAVASAGWLRDTDQAKSVEPGAKSESVYDRVMRTATIRCAYIVASPGLIKNPNTGELSGIVFDVMQRAGERLGLEVEWVEEVSFATMIEGLSTDRYDAVCSQIWPTPQRARQITFSNSLYYNSMGIWVRADDNRFAVGNVEQFNEPSIKIASIDGAMSDAVASSDFPKAEVVALPDLASVGERMLLVVNSKADLSLEENYAAFDFLKSNPGTLKNLVPNQPLRSFPNTVALKRGEVEFKDMLNVAIDEIVNSGYIDVLFDKYEISDGALFPPQVPY